MAIPHAAPGDIIDVRPLGAALVSTPAHAVFKSSDLEVIRLVMLAGNEMASHAVNGEITIQCLEGRIALTCDAGERALTAGQLVHLLGHEKHALRALEDSSLLLTIVVKKDAGSANGTPAATEAVR